MPIYDEPDPNWNPNPNPNPNPPHDPERLASVQQAITGYYNQYFGRDPDPAGLDHYTKLAYSQGLSAVQQQLSQSNEASAYDLYSQLQSDMAGANLGQFRTFGEWNRARRGIWNDWTRDVSNAGLTWSGGADNDLTDPAGATNPWSVDLGIGDDTFWYGWNWDQFQQATLQPPSHPTGPAPSPGPGGTFGGGGPSPGDYPRVDLPQFDRPEPVAFREYRQGDPFSFEDFRAPTLEDARNEPGYEFARSEGLRGLSNLNAAKGLSRTGGAYKGVVDWGNRFAEQNYGNVYNRAASTYGLRRSNAFENYVGNEANRHSTYLANRDTHYGNVDRTFSQAYDTFRANTENQISEFNPEFRAHELSFDEMYRRWRDSLSATARIATAGAGS